jgi:hypothetical protein
MDYKIVLGMLAAIISIVSYIPYFRDCIKRRTKPSPYTWSIWSIITLIAFLALLSSGAGPGSWVSGATVLIDVTVVVFALRNTKIKPSTVDTVCFALAILAIILWKITNNALYAIILVVIADALGFMITFKKTYSRPYEETLLTYSFAALKYVLAFLALNVYSLTTTIYPVYLVIFNAAFVCMAVIRRKTYQKSE